MNKEVNIKVKSEILQDGKSEEIKFKTKGKFYKKNDKYYLSYNEEKLSGMEKNRIILIIEKSKIIMNRYGETKSKMVFKLNKKTYADYETPYGNFDMEILTKKKQVDLNKGIIKIDYLLNIKNLSKGKNSLFISFKKK
ncbi:MAG: DUF1934 domain-containing protein [Bacillota bacterium]